MRKHKVVTIAAEGRDKGKSFLVLEMPAMQAEKWAAKALLAMGRAGVEVPDDALGAGALGVLLLGLAGVQQMRFEDAEPLLDEMLTCIHFVPDPSRADPMSGRPITRPLILEGDAADIEEVSSLLMLRGEAVELHVGFSPAAVLSTMAAALTSRQQTTSTSPNPAERRSRRAKQA